MAGEEAAIIGLIGGGFLALQIAINTPGEFPFDKFLYWLFSRLLLFLSVMGTWVFWPAATFPTVRAAYFLVAVAIFVFALLIGIYEYIIKGAGKFFLKAPSFVEDIQK